MRLVELGRLTPVVDSVCPLQDIADVHRRAEQGALGKVVLDVGGPPG